MRLKGLKCFQFLLKINILQITESERSKRSLGVALACCHIATQRSERALSHFPVYRTDLLPVVPDIARLALKDPSVISFPGKTDLLP